MSRPPSGGRASKAKKTVTKTPPINKLINNLDLCPECENTVKSNENGLNCDECSQWWHARCCDISDEKYMWLADSDNLLFVCDICKSKRKVGESQSKPTDITDNAELVKQMKEMMVCMKEVLEKHNDMIASNEKLEARVAKLEQIKPNESQDKNVESMIEDKVDEAIREAREQEARKLNLIMVNVPENIGDDSNQRDLEAVNKLMKKILPEEQEVKIDEIYRFGKVNIGTQPRLLKIKVQSVSMKREILKNSAKLNEGSGINDPKRMIYVNPDYTKRERTQNYALRAELKSKPKDERAKYTIRNGKVVLKDAPADSTGGE